MQDESLGLYKGTIQIFSKYELLCVCVFFLNTIIGIIRLETALLECTAEGTAWKKWVAAQMEIDCRQLKSQFVGLLESGTRRWLDLVLLNAPSQAWANYGPARSAFQAGPPNLKKW